jgi:SPP1 family predicted phage head-tail adaptor
MDAGALDQHITIERPSLTTNALGEQITSWVVDGTPWARVIETPGREFLKGGIEAEGKAAFVIRWRALDSAYRVTWGGRVYQIEDVTGTRREGYCWLHCRSVVGAN